MVKQERMYSYDEVLEFDKDRKRYLETLQDRLESYHEAVEIYRKKKEMINPEDLLELFAIIDMKHKIV